MPKRKRKHPEASSDPGEAQAFSSASIEESSVTIVLLGKSGSGKSASGNTILGRTEFISTPSWLKLRNVAKECHLGKTEADGKQVCVIDTPDLLDPHLSDQEAARRKESIVTLSYPRVHAFLLVVPVGDDLQDEQEVLETLVQLFGQDALRYTMVLFTKGDELDDAEMIEQYIENKGKELNQLVQDCGGRMHVLNNKMADNTSQVSVLFNKIDAMIETNGGKPCIVSKRRKSMDFDENLSEVGATHGEQEELRLVLFGKTGSGKSACGNTILGKEMFPSNISSASQTVHCKRKDGVRNGKPIAVVDSPGLFDTKLSNTEVIGEICKCIGLSSPGPHAFLLVVQIGRFTPEERSSVQQIKNAFGKDVGRYTMVLFTHKDKLGDKTIEQFIQTGDSDLKKLIEECGGRYHCLDNSSRNYTQVTELLGKVQTMVTDNGGTYYSNKMFQEVGKEIMAIQEKNMGIKIEELKKENKSTSKTEFQRIYSHLLEESRNKAVEILFSDRVALAIATLSNKVKVTPKEREAALEAAEQRGITQGDALKLVSKATCKLARTKVNMCLTQ